MQLPVLAQPDTQDLRLALALLTGLSLALLVLFAQFPELDLVVSGWFFHDGFVGRHELMARIAYDAVYIAFGLALVVIIYSAWQARRGRNSWRLSVFLLSSLLLGPGVLVNWVLKELSGRARPDALSYFGGDKLFTAPWHFTDQCATNCAFVSGHASMGFYFVALAFVFARSRSRFWLLFANGWLLGLIFGGFRIYQGRHFLSDVLWSGLVVSFTACALYWLLVLRSAAKD